MQALTLRVRDLRAGDIIPEPTPAPVGGAAAYVVLDVAIADPGPVGLQLGRLGEIAPHLNRVATVAWNGDQVLQAQRPQPPRRTPDATVDQHLDAVLRASGSALRHYSMPKTLADMRAAMRAALEGSPINHP